MTAFICMAAIIFALSAITHIRRIRGVDVELPPKWTSFGDLVVDIVFIFWAALLLWGNS